MRIDPTPSAPADPVLAAAQLADAAGRASTLLSDYRCDHPDEPGAAQSLELEKALDRRAIELRTQAIAMLGARSAEAATRLQEAVRRIDAFLVGVKAADARIALAGAVFTLAGAVLGGDAGAVLNAASGVHAAIETAQGAASSG
ncbi:MAG: hypothetical protein ABW032_05085 [Burkholderiaceae bacterium]